MSNACSTLLCRCVLIQSRFASTEVHYRCAPNFYACFAIMALTFISHFDGININDITRVNAFKSTGCRIFAFAPCWCQRDNPLGSCSENLIPTFDLSSKSFIEAFQGINLQKTILTLYISSGPI